MSFRPERQRSGGIHPSCKNNLRKVKSATWEDPSTPFHFGRDDMSGGGSVLTIRVVFVMLYGDESSPLHCVIPFNHSGSIRNVITVNCQLKPIVNCPLSIVNFSPLPYGFMCAFWEKIGTPVFGVPWIFKLPPGPFSRGRPCRRPRRAPWRWSSRWARRSRCPGGRRGRRGPWPGPPGGSGPGRWRS